jgi:hypothetical protein
LLVQQHCLATRQLVPRLRQPKSEDSNPNSVCQPDSDIALGGTGTVSAADSVGGNQALKVKIGTSYGGNALGVAREGVGGDGTT